MKTKGDSAKRADQRVWKLLKTNTEFWGTPGVFGERVWKVLKTKKALWRFVSKVLKVMKLKDKDVDMNAKLKKRRGESEAVAGTGCT